MKRPATTFAASSLLGAALAFGALTAGPAAAGDTALLPADASSCEIFRTLSRVIPGHCAQNPFGSVRSLRLRNNQAGAATNATPIAADAIAAAPAAAVPALDVDPAAEVA